MAQIVQTVLKFAILSDRFIQSIFVEIKLIVAVLRNMNSRTLKELFLRKKDSRNSVETCHEINHVFKTCRYDGKVILDS